MVTLSALEVIITINFLPLKFQHAFCDIVLIFFFLSTMNMSSKKYTSRVRNSSFTSGTYFGQTFAWVVKNPIETLNFIEKM